MLIAAGTSRPQPLYRARIRSLHAPHCLAPSPHRPTHSRRSAPIRHTPMPCRCCRSLLYRRLPRLPLGSRHQHQLPARVHAAEKAHHLGHLHWRNPWSDSSHDWLGRCYWFTRYRRMAALRHSFSLAIPALPRHLLDVPRRLRPRWHPDASRRRQRRHAHLPPNHSLCRHSRSGQPASCRMVGLTGVLYFFGALVTCTASVQFCLWAAASKSNSRAKWLMHVTVMHIPILLGLMMYDKLPR